jgi:hypothetical protein
MELSHHLAHAWSAAPFSGSDESLVLVMDGMGEHLRAMTGGDGAADDPAYAHDLKAAGPVRDAAAALAERAGGGHREAESAYLFSGGKPTPVFKRWTAEVSPPELANHGFGDMDSLGAMYSRVSSHVFGGAWPSRARCRPCLPRLTRPPPSQTGTRAAK